MLQAYSYTRRRGAREKYRLADYWRSRRLFRRARSHSYGHTSVGKTEKKLFVVQCDAESAVSLSTTTHVDISIRSIHILSLKIVYTLYNKMINITFIFDQTRSIVWRRRGDDSTKAIPRIDRHRYIRSRQPHQLHIDMSLLCCCCCQLLPLYENVGTLLYASPPPARHG